MVVRCARHVVLSVLLAVLVLPPLQARAATVRDFTPLFSVQTNGATVVTGNSLLSCAVTDAACRNVLNGTTTGSGANNNAWTMVRVDRDDDAGTTSSSGADVTIPSGARVLFAGLFWGAARTAGSGGTGSTADGTTMRLRVPGSASYTTVTANQTDYLTGVNRDYSSYANVTAQVQAAGSGTYWGADVAAGTGRDRYAGWSLVVTYQDPNAPLRDLTVFGGYARITGTDVEQTTISGFLAPPSGAVNARFGMVTYEGDVGVNGDYFAVNGTRLSDTLSPAANFFGSRITDGGANLTGRDPASVNNLGLDAKVVDAPGVVPNGATSAQLNFATNGEAYYPAALTTSIDLYAPTIQGDKTVRNLSGNTPARIGDTLEYTLTYTNTGDDDAIGSVVRDVLPPDTSYVPESLQVGSSAQSDDAADDLAEYDAAGRTVRFRVGTGANQLTGGRLTKDAVATVRFRVTVDRAAAGTTIPNTGFLDYTAETLGTPFSYETPPVSTPVAESADLTVGKTADRSTAQVGDNVTYTVRVRNDGPSSAVGVAVAERLPAGLRLVSARPSTGTYDQAAGTWYVGTLASGATATLTLIATATAAGTVVNGVRVTAPDTPDPDPADNTAQTRITVTAPTTAPTTPPTTPPTVPQDPSEPSEPAEPPAEPSDGDLGDTGSPFGPVLLLTGAGAVLAGAVLLVAARRRAG
jgi:uncharacterized repeat protein (TIGR01451 family)